MAAGGSVTKICLAAALAGSVGLALYYGYKKRQKSSDTGENESKVRYSIITLKSILLFFLCTYRQTDLHKVMIVYT